METARKKIVGDDGVEFVNEYKKFLLGQTTETELEEHMDTLTDATSTLTSLCETLLGKCEEYQDEVVRLRLQLKSTDQEKEALQKSLRLAIQLTLNLTNSKLK